MMCNFHKVLVLAPHTDDGELGCGGSMVRFLETGCEVHYVAFSTAQQSLPWEYPPDTLKVEVAAATQELGIAPENLHIHDFEVRKLNYVRQDILEIMVRLRREVEPDLVFMPSLNDVHQDHSTVAQEGLRAFKGKTVLAYELIWNNLNFNTCCFVALERWHVDKKVAAMGKYLSQSGRQYSAPDFILALARTRGVQIGVEFAECFEVIRWII